jgi:hypothetical protein
MQSRQAIEFEHAEPGWNVAATTYDREFRDAGRSSALRRGATGVYRNVLL